MAQTQTPGDASASRRTLPEFLTSDESPQASRLTHEDVVHIHELTEEAVSLAERGALYASRARLTEVLRRIARNLDGNTAGQPHSQALAQAFRALDEADDFTYGGMELEADLETGSFINGHETPVLKGHDSVSPVRALEAYHRYARDQMVVAAGREVAAARVLYAFGRVEQRLREACQETRKGAARELPMFEASLVINPRDALTANELGVSLCREGQLNRAVEALQFSATLAPSPVTLANLSKVHGRLRSDEQMSIMTSPAPARLATQTPRRPRVEFVPTQQFAGQSDATVQRPGPNSNQSVTGVAGRFQSSPTQSIVPQQSGLWSGHAPLASPATPQSMWQR
ncbi:MAG: hypothetical protein KDA60_18835 [Planctomycetales bacterium]|nr:hypothetical protein [Planctomycetales bacterium]